MSPWTQRSVFYTSAAIVTVVVWISLARFARLPSGIHIEFFAALFAPFIIGLVALSSWFEQRLSKKAKESNQPPQPIRAKGPLG
jgi:hypothetical protein